MYGNTRTQTHTHSKGTQHNEQRQSQTTAPKRRRPPVTTKHQATEKSESQLPHSVIASLFHSPTSTSFPQNQSTNKATDRTDSSTKQNSTKQNSTASPRSTMIVTLTEFNDLYDPAMVSKQPQHHVELLRAHDVAAIELTDDIAAGRVFMMRASDPDGCSSIRSAPSPRSILRKPKYSSSSTTASDNDSDTSSAAAMEELQSFSMHSAPALSSSSVSLSSATASRRVSFRRAVTQKFLREQTQSKLQSRCLRRHTANKIRLAAEERGEVQKNTNRRLERRATF